MPTIGLIVEGPYDEAAIPIFVGRCRAGVKIITRKCRGSVTGRLAGILAELDLTPRIERVFAISDADGEEPTRLLFAMRTRIADNYRFVVTPIIIVEMLEAWLIADSEALKHVLGSGRSFPHPERIRDPKAELARLFSWTAGYTPEAARRIAEKIDLELLGRRCPRFLAFREAVLGSDKSVRKRNLRGH